MQGDFRKWPAVARRNGICETQAREERDNFLFFLRR